MDEVANITRYSQQEKPIQGDVDDSQIIKDKNKKGKELRLQDKISQSSFQLRIKEFIKSKKVNPWVIELDPTTACNLACHGCISANLLNQGGFDRGRIKDLAKEFYNDGVKAVVCDLAIDMCTDMYTATCRDMCRRMLLTVGK